MVGAMPQPLYYQERPGTHYIGESNGKLLLRTCPGCKVPEPTSRLTELWSLPKPAQGLNTYNNNPLYRLLGGLQDRSGMGEENRDPTGIRSPDRPARSVSLHRLSYPGPLY